MSKLNFCWIDDDENKINQYINAIQHGLQAFPEGSIVTKIVVNKDLLSLLDNLTTSDNSAPDLIIIDHIFSKIKLPLKLKGSSVAHLLRGSWPNVPMICVTGALLNQPKKFDQEDLSEYTAVFQYGDLHSHIEQIYAIARDFPSIPTSSKKLRETLAQLILVPNSEKSTFLRILPAEFDGVTYLTTQHRIAHWIFNVFMVRPGFLYNKLRAATYLGLNENGFDKIKHMFEPARYIGPFHTNSNPLWWVTELEKVLLSKTPDDGPDTTQLMGRALNGISIEDYSSCYVSEKPDDIPDVVARLAPSNDEKAVCIRHTQNDPNDKAVNPGFENLLVISHR